MRTESRIAAVKVDGARVKIPSRWVAQPVVRGGLTVAMKRLLMSGRMVPAPFAVPVGSGVLLCIGGVAAALHGRVPGVTFAALCSAVVLVAMLVAEPLTAAPLGLVAWMTATAFARAPYGTLHPWGHQAAVSAAAVGGGLVVGLPAGFLRRALSDSSARATLVPVTSLAGFASAIDRRRQLYATAIAAALLPLLTVVLTGHPLHLSLADNLLIYLLVVVLVAVVGGFWPAVASAIAASLLLNWYFTRPFHTFTINEPDNLLALLLFVVVAISVSSVVHLAARRAVQAARSRAEAEALLQLARTVLGGDDTPAAVIRALHEALGVGVELLERAGASWVRVAASGDTSTAGPARVPVRDDMMLMLHGRVSEHAQRLVEAGAGQAAAAVDRDRLRTQAAQAEALAAGNRMRTALLAAVSHDLRTPLASIKASVSSLRQTDVHWSPQDEAALLETVEESADRLDSLIANLLDMTRVHTGALQPYLQPAAVDEVAPLALRGLAEGRSVQLDVPEDLPLVYTDPGLLERALANLVSNALRYSPAGRPPSVTARLDGAPVDGARVEIAVVDQGPGVAADQRERMFEPFQRLGDTDATTGVGLGLAVARGFVDSLGGTLTASETPGGGLTMTVSLPVAPADSLPHFQAHS